MARSSAQTVDQCLAELPEARREALACVRSVIVQHLPEGYKETMQHGMISYVVPLETFPKTYNGQPLLYAALASQKSYMSAYLMNVYGDPETEHWFVEQYMASGKKLDMGKSCVRFKTLDALPLELVCEAIARTSVAKFIELYQDSRRRR